MSTPDRFLGTEEVSQQIGMSQEWIRRQVHAGRLRARIFLGANGRSTYRYAQSAVDDFLAQFSVDSKGDGRAIDPE